MTHPKTMLAEALAETPLVMVDDTDDDRRVVDKEGYGGSYHYQAGAIATDAGGLSADGLAFELGGRNSDDFYRVVLDADALTAALAQRLGVPIPDPVLTAWDEVSAAIDRIVLAQPSQMSLAAERLRCQQAEFRALLTRISREGR